MPTLQNDTELEQSPVVANNAMNRERRCLGANSYERDLGLDAVAFLVARRAETGRAAWLDVCCGRGRALAEAAVRLDACVASTRITLVGVDLVRAFDPLPAEAKCVQFVEANISTWAPERAFDLITCVHGLHYVGDKLGVIARICSWLVPDGVFLANLDIANLHAEGSRGGHPFTRAFRAAGLRYESRDRLLRCVGARTTAFPFVYLGADEAAGPNYTGQPAVGSWYRKQPE